MSCTLHIPILYCMHAHYTHICRLIAAAYSLHAEHMLTLSMQADINAALTQTNYMHTSQRHTTPSHHAPRKPPMCMFTVCIQRVFMCLLLMFAACMMASFMHGACVCATTCMWHACVRDAIVQCMSMHAVCGMHVCVVCIHVAYRQA
jgi:hypothetical protein